MHDRTEAKMNQAGKTEEKEERTRDNSGEVKIFGKGDDIQTAAESRPSGRVAFVIVFLLAIFCICFGIYKAWESFREFDETILKEKDTQFYSLINSEDIST